MARILSVTFIEDLKQGILKPILDRIQSDHTLEFNIRENYVNIYYRGGNVLRISEKVPHRYEYWFDINYGVSRTPAEMVQIQKCLSDKDWVNFFPLAKQAMDYYFSDSSKEEREFAQLVVRENNYSGIANGTDYFIIDYEYDNHQGARFDLVAVEWPSNQVHRKMPQKHKPKLVVLEMKYGDGAMKGIAGMVKHTSDFEKFLANANQVCSFKLEMVNLFKQKRELGLIKFGSTGNKHSIEEFCEEIDMIFLLANHDPESNILKEVVGDIGNLFPEFRVKIITANFLGYGLYNHKISTLTPISTKAGYAL